MLLKLMVKYSYHAGLLSETRFAAPYFLATCPCTYQSPRRPFSSITICFCGFFVIQHLSRSPRFKRFAGNGTNSSPIKTHKPFTLNYDLSHLFLYINYEQRTSVVVFFFSFFLTACREIGNWVQPITARSSRLHFFRLSSAISFALLVCGSVY